ncbi:MAG TPA: A24 family peptidase [Sphingorhabdus sp.]|nr:A24 family peptidase [Sphingorhabdus sp.]
MTLAEIGQLPPQPWLALFAVFFGAILGSYLGVVVIRWPSGEAASQGRSKCDHCGRQIDWFDLIPLLSFLLLKGRCRSCHAKIDWAQAAAEWSCAIFCGLAFLLFPIVEAVAFSILCLLLVPLALLDARHYWLPDRLILLLALVGILAGGYLSEGVDLGMRIWAALITFAVLELLRKLFRAIRGSEGMGAGDPKLFAALALWFSPLQLPLLLLLASLMGIIGALLLRKRMGPQIPFGTLLAVAAVLLPLAKAF